MSVLLAEGNGDGDAHNAARAAALNSHIGSEFEGMLQIDLTVLSPDSSSDFISLQPLQSSSRRSSAHSSVAPPASIRLFQSQQRDYANVAGANLGSSRAHSRPLLWIGQDFASNSIIDESEESPFALLSAAAQVHRQPRLKLRPGSASLLPLMNMYTASSASSLPAAALNSDMFLHQKLTPMSPSRRAASPTRRSPSPQRRRGSTSPVRGKPFNFKPQVLATQNIVPSRAAHRKGHKYKHSSVSMNMFQDTEPLLTLRGRLWQIPDLYPIPSASELLASVSHQQKRSAAGAGAHLLLAAAVFVAGTRYELPPMSTLAHLVFYDALGSIVSVLVSVLANFDVWTKLSLAHPYGIGRLHVLVGFALGASLVMLGLDLVSHFAEEFIILMVVEASSSGDTAEAGHLPDSDSHPHHHAEALSHHIHGGHGKSPTNWVAYNVILGISMIATLCSSRFILGTHTATSSKLSNSVFSHEHTLSRGVIGETNDEKNTNSNQLLRKLLNVWHQYLGEWSRNPTHFLTIVYCCYLIVLPLAPAAVVSDTEIDLDEMASLVVAVFVCHTGWRLVQQYGSILMCLHPRLGYEYAQLRQKISDRVLELELVQMNRDYTLTTLYISKFNHELYVVGAKIQMLGATADEESVVRFKVGHIIRQEIEASQVAGSPCKIESTVDIVRA